MEEPNTSIEVIGLCYFLSVLSQESSISSSPLILNDLFILKALSLVCKGVFKIVKTNIENKFWFVQRNKQSLRVFCWYSPLRMKGVFFDSSMPFKTINLPPNLTHLEFSNYFNMPMDNLLPPNIIYLKMGFCFDQPINNLPPKITHLIFSSDFNQNVDFLLPPNLTHLKFGDAFDFPVDHLPPNLTNLVFSTHFNHFVDHFPPKIIELTMGFDFNKPICNLPQSVTHLKLGHHFDQKISNLPPNLIFLAFSHHFNQNVDFLLPPNLTHLRFKFKFNKIVQVFPQSVTHLQFGTSRKKTMAELCRSELLDRNLRNPKYDFTPQIDYLPPLLIELTLGFQYKRLDYQFPNNLNIVYLH